MKRTVNAWVVLGPKGGCRSIWRNSYKYGAMDMVPCVVTYDDGAKRPPRRRSGREK